MLEPSLWLEGRQWNGRKRFGVKLLDNNCREIARPRTITMVRFTARSPSLLTPITMECILSAMTAAVERIRG